jgi:hypothetical protein
VRPYREIRNNKVTLSCATGHIFRSLCAIEFSPSPESERSMAVFLISYDLRKPDYDYDPLYEELAALNAKHVQDSVWGVRTTKSAEAVFDALWAHMHNEKDRLFVVTFDKEQQYKSNNAITKLKDI